MPLFNHHISFKQIDPLENGLREEILAEQAEPESIGVLEEGVDEGTLSQYWQQVEADIEKDPEWFRFSKNE